MQLPLSEVKMYSSQGGLPAGQLKLLVLDTDLSLPALQLKLSNLCALLLEQKCSKKASVLHLLELNMCLLNLELKMLAAHLHFNQREVQLKGLHIHF